MKLPRIPLILLAAALLALAAGCRQPRVGDVISVATASSPRAAVEGIVRREVVSYAERGLRELIEALVREAGGEWGKEAERTPPTQKRYVKYTQNYLSRAVVDFDAGIVRVETLDQAKPLESLKSAIVTTLLTPEDPRAVDMFSAQAVKLTGRPYLAGEVLDHEGQAILYPWRAGRFADWLIAHRVKSRRLATPKGERAARFVEVAMVPDHLEVRARKYQPLVAKASRRFGVSSNLINAIIKTESDFNPFAVSSAPAYGLMQIVPTTAGRDAYPIARGRNGTPSRGELFDPARNIELGSAYLSLLQGDYLEGISDSVSREYCVIAAYNGGIGNVLRSFSRDQRRAPDAINRLPPADVYARLQARMPDETKRYLRKVLGFKRDFVGS